MTVVRITIKKILHRSAYHFGRAAILPFSSEYLVRTNAAFLSAQLDAYAKGIARAESRLHPTSVVFDYVSVKLATPGASSEELRGQFSHVSETPGQKMTGQWLMGEDDALAFPFVSAVYARQTQWGRDGRLLIPHVITGTEWNLTTHKQVEPLRFQGPDAQSPASSDQIPSLSLTCWFALPKALPSQRRTKRRASAGCRLKCWAWGRAPVAKPRNHDAGFCSGARSGFYQHDRPNIFD